MTHYTHTTSYLITLIEMYSYVLLKSVSVKGPTSESGETTRRFRAPASLAEDPGLVSAPTE